MDHTLEVLMEPDESYWLHCRLCDWRRSFSQDVEWAPSVEDIIWAATEHRV